MPPINSYTCNECDFELPSGWGGYTYAVDNLGRRVVCPHPGEPQTVYEVTGLNYAEVCDAGRVGFAQYCVCIDCLKQFDLDLERDATVCPECASHQVRSLRNLIGQTCPKCKVGLIKEGSVIRWQLDPDWALLPVPQVVKDLTEFANRQHVPTSLQRASEIADTVGDGIFFIVTIRLLNWWEGDYFAENSEQCDSVEMRPQWTWCHALSVVIGATPELAELVTVRDGRCWFAEGVSPDARRGIKNYLRKYRKHVIWS